MVRRGVVAAAAAVGVAVVGMSAPGAWASSGKSQGTAGSTSHRSTSSGGNAPAGNNGHIQIDEYAMDGGNGNDPHVGCGFSVSFFGYDAGARTASVAVTPWAPTRGGNPFHSGALTWQVTQRTGGNQLDFNYPVSATTVAGIFSGVAPAHQGYHARIEVEVNGSQGSDDKYKMVWIAPCAPGSAGAAPTNAAATPSGGAPTASSGANGSASSGPNSASVPGSSVRPAVAAGSSTGASSSSSGPGAVAGRVAAAGSSTPVAVLGESVSRPLAAAPAGASTGTLGGLPFTGADIALESLVSLGLVGTGAFLTRRYRLRRR